MRYDRRNECFGGLPFQGLIFRIGNLLSLVNVDNNYDSELDVRDLLWIYTSLISLEQRFTVDAVLISKFFPPVYWAASDVVSGS